MATNCWDNAPTESFFKNLEEVRAVVAEFKDRYNRHWRLERMGFMSPLEVRQAYAMRKAA